MKSSDKIKHPVCALLEARKKSVKDSYKLALVIEGGCFRGALTAGMISALHELGYTADLFDIVMGCSAGAFNGAYYISGNPEDGVRIYPDYMTQKSFIDRLGWLKGKPIVNLSAVTDHFLEHSIPINWDKIISSRKFYAVTADPTEVGTKILSPPSSKDELKIYLKATSHIPILAGAPPLINGLPYYDGSLTAPLPIEQAIKLGSTHILALSNRNLREWRNKQTLFEHIVSGLYDHKYPGIGKSIRESVEKAHERARTLINKRDNPMQQPYVYTVDVPEGLVIHQLETDRSKVETDIRIGVSALKDKLPRLS